MLYYFDYAISEYFYQDIIPKVEDKLKIMTNGFKITKANLLNFNNCVLDFYYLDSFLSLTNNFYTNNSVFNIINYNNNNNLRLDLKEWQMKSTFGFYNNDEVRFFYENIFKQSEYYKLYNFDMMIITCDTNYNTTCYNSYDFFKNTCFPNMKIFIEKDITFSTLNFDNICYEKMWYLYKKF